MIAIQFTALVLLMLVTGIFWGPWFALHRSIGVFSSEALIHIVKTISANLAKPMKILMPVCIIFLLLYVITYPQKNFFGFYLCLASLCLLIIALIITIMVEVPIVSQIQKWTQATVPDNWEAIRDRWVKFHVYRTIAAIGSFITLSSSIFALQ